MTKVGLDEPETKYCTANLYQKSQNHRCVSKWDSTCYANQDHFWDCPTSQSQSLFHQNLLQLWQGSPLHQTNSRKLLFEMELHLSLQLNWQWHRLPVKIVLEASTCLFSQGLQLLTVLVDCLLQTTWFVVDAST